MSFVYHKPEALAEALALIALKGRGLPILAGGTDLIVQWRSGAIRPTGLIDISGIEELAEISVKGSYIEIGALATHARIASDENVGEHAPALAQACSTIGGPQIQNMGTIGGNIMNASPAGDTAPAVLAYDAELVAKDLKGERHIGADEFFTGYRETALRPDELLTAVRIRIPDEPLLARFYRIGARRAQVISKVSMCMCGKVAHGGIERVRIALGSVAPTVIRARGTEALLAGKVINAGLIDKARRSLADEIRPIDDIRSTADYRKYAAVGLLMRYLREATKKI